MGWADVVFARIAVPHEVEAIHADLFLHHADVAGVVVERVDAALRLAFQAIALEHGVAFETDFAVRANKVLHTGAAFPRFRQICLVEGSEAVATGAAVHFSRRSRKHLRLYRFVASRR